MSYNIPGSMCVGVTVWFSWGGVVKFEFLNSTGLYVISDISEKRAAPYVVHGAVTGT